jgi:hypothetical protein
MRADLGVGTGAMCERLHALGCQVVAVGRDSAGYPGKYRFVAQDLNHAALLLNYNRRRLIWLLSWK